LSAGHALAQLRRTDILLLVKQIVAGLVFIWFLTTRFSIRFISRSAIIYVLVFYIFLTNLFSLSLVLVLI